MSDFNGYDNALMMATNINQIANLNIFGVYICCITIGI